MTNVQSKFLPIDVSCIHYVHPWTDSCLDASAGLLLSATQECLRIYSIVYLVSLVMKCRIPDKKQLLRTLQGIIQSSAFLTTNAFTYYIFLCLIRRFAGNFNFLTLSYVPSFLASLCAILVERKSRRELLCLYVANVATESVWRMAASRNMVKPVKHGTVLLFGVSTAMLTLYYRYGLHHLAKDSLFNVLRYVVGKQEEYQCVAAPPTPLPTLPSTPSTSAAAATADLNVHIQQSNTPAATNSTIAREKRPKKMLIKLFDFIDNLKIIPRHKTCPHRHNCVAYTIYGGSKLFFIGIGIQILLKLVLNIERLVRNPSSSKNIFLNRDVLKLGLFLGEFSAVFRACCCAMRHIFEKDHPISGLLSGLIAGTAFRHYPDHSIALYIMWKFLHITYNIGTEKKLLPKFPGFTILLYCASTALLFHTATFEPKNMRPSYWKFLYNLSDTRIVQMDRKCLEVYGLDTGNAMREVMKRTKTEKLSRLY